MITEKADQPDYVKVLDFGIAKTMADDGADNVTKTGFVLGDTVALLFVAGLVRRLMAMPPTATTPAPATEEV